MLNYIRNIFLFLFLVISTHGFCQTKQDTLDNDSLLLYDDSLVLDCFTTTEPMFSGGEDSLNEYLIRTINYPDSAQALKISGTVYISFIVEVDGSISTVKLLSGIGGGCDKEALRAIRNMPNWIPARCLIGEGLRTGMKLPIKFSLDNEKNENDSIY